MPPTKPPYPPEFRREAVQLARTSERSIAQAARDLGVSSQTLHTWIKQADVDAGKKNPKPPQWEMYDLETDPLEKKNLAFEGYERSEREEAQFQRLKRRLARVEKRA